MEEEYYIPFGMLPWLSCALQSHFIKLYSAVKQAIWSLSIKNKEVKPTTKFKLLQKFIVKFYCLSWPQMVRGTIHANGGVLMLWSFSYPCILTIQLSLDPVSRICSGLMERQSGTTRNSIQTKKWESDLACKRAAEEEEQQGQHQLRKKIWNLFWIGCCGVHVMLPQWWIREWKGSSMEIGYKN
jgi:hypothetical protein